MDLLKSRQRYWLRAVIVSVAIGVIVGLPQAIIQFPSLAQWALRWRWHRAWSAQKTALNERIPSGLSPVYASIAPSLNAALDVAEAQHDDALLRETFLFLKIIADNAR